jgi:hypothetical protein
MYSFRAVTAIERASLRPRHPLIRNVLYASAEALFEVQFLGPVSWVPIRSCLPANINAVTVFSPEKLSRILAPPTHPAIVQFLHQF